MRKKNKADEKVSSKKRKQESHQFETMSQVQNRYGKGRQQNGSDGGRHVTANNH